jgi:RHS repeat-associated protein
MPETNFFWDPLSDNILQERDETGTVTAEYTTEPGLYGNLMGQNRGSGESQYHFDALGSTLALTDANQQVTDTYAYAAFGAHTEGIGGSINPYNYIGQRGYYYDDTSVQLIVRRRILIPTAGQWASRDPVRWDVIFGGSPYSYSHNRPTHSLDPSGLKEVPGPWPIVVIKEPFLGLYPGELSNPDPEPHPPPGKDIKIPPYPDCDAGCRVKRKFLAPVGKARLVGIWGKHIKTQCYKQVRGVYEGITYNYETYEATALLTITMYEGVVRFGVDCEVAPRNESNDCPNVAPDESGNECESRYSDAVGPLWWGEVSTGKFGKLTRVGVAKSRPAGMARCP